MHDHLAGRRARRPGQRRRRRPDGRGGRDRHDARRRRRVRVRQHQRHVHRRLHRRDHEHRHGDVADWIDASAAGGHRPAGHDGGWNPGGTVPVSLFYAAIPLTAGKQVASVTLPTVGAGVGKNVPSMHVFSLTVGSPGRRGGRRARRRLLLRRGPQGLRGHRRRTAASKAWYTVADGMLSDVYAPTIDNTDVKSLDPIVTGPGFTALQPRDMTYTVASLDATGMACEITAHDAAHDFNVVTDFITDPSAEAVVMRFTLVPLPGAPAGLHLYLRFNPLLNGHAGGGTDNAGGESATVVATPRGAHPAVVLDRLVHRGGEPQLRHADLRGAGRQQPFPAVETGFDGNRQRRADRAGQLGRAQPRRRRRTPATATSCRPSSSPATAEHGGARLRRQPSTARSAPRWPPRPRRSPRPTAPTRRGWRAYDAGCCRRRRGHSFGHVDAAQVQAAYWLSANVIKASEDKTFPGATRRLAGQPVGPGGPGRADRERRAGAVLRLLPRGVPAGRLRDVHRVPHRRRPGHRPADGRGTGSMTCSCPTGRSRATGC